jgi:tetratricopeptide (TPR) repeat protein
MNKFLLIIVLLIGFLPLNGQNLTVYFNYINRDELDPVRSAIPRLMQKYPNSPGVQYLSALVEQDADKALLIYKDILSQYPNSDYADDALTKIIEYLYAKGLYSKTINYSKQLIRKYPDSDNIDKCVLMLLCSFSITNKKDSVDYYYEYYLKRYPQMNLQFADYQVAPSLVIEDKATARLHHSEKTSPPPIPSPKALPRELFTLQVGAFANPQNALVLKNRLQSLGYDSYIEKIRASNRELLSVRIGNYPTQNEAKETGERLKARHNVNYIVIRKD